MSSTDSHPDPRVEGIARLIGIVDRLRAPDGCPWDREQTIESMAPHLVEEAFETLEAIEEKQDADIAEEAGDVLMVITLICRIAEQSGRFDLGLAANAVGDKLIRRHPHVFGDASADDAKAVLANWEAIKKEERNQKEHDDSALAGIPVSLPALQRAGRACAKAVSAGFRWSDIGGAIRKVHEEGQELTQALSEAGLDASGAQEPPLGPQRERVAHELGDLLLATAFLGSYLELDPEKLCREAVRRFERRFRSMETALDGPLAEHSLESLIQAWEAAKARLGH